jgi:hypothetical protein
MTIQQIFLISKISKLENIEKNLNTVGLLEFPILEFQDRILETLGVRLYPEEIIRNPNGIS